MPQITLTFPDEAAIPAELKAFKGDGNTVSVWAGDKVAEETNPGLAANRDAIKTEKDKLQTNYEKLVTSTGQISNELNDLRTKVATGAAITQDELAIVTALKGIDGTPDEIKKKLTEFPVLQSKLTSLETTQQNREIAEVMGWKPSVFNDLRNHPEKSKDLSFALEDVTDNGVTKKKAFVTAKDASGTTTKTDLAAFVEATPAWNEYLPLLKTSGNQSGPQWVSQGKTGGDNDGSKSAVQAHIDAKNAAAKAAPNPLMPTPSAQQVGAAA